MKRLIPLLLILAIVACTEREDPVPEADLQSLRGQWVLINYWAQWCKPCIEEIPHLNTVDQTYDQVTVLGVNYDGASGAELESQRQKLGIEFVSMESDPAAQLGIPRPVVLPTTLVLDPDGQLVTTLIGPQTLDSLVQATSQKENGVLE